MKVGRTFIFLISLAVVACGCYPNEFKNVHAKAPHAILRGTSYPNAGHAFPTHINGQPTSFWRMDDVFRIHPGSNGCKIAFSDRKETFGFDTAHFVTIAGGEYVISRKRDASFASPFKATPHPTTTNSWVIQDWRDRAIIQEVISNNSNIVADVPKVDYVFGVSSSNLAIGQYRQKNP
jgi:hypothetical protein